MADYPSLCLFPAAATDDPLLARVAAEQGLGGRRPGVLIGEEAGMRRVVISAEGQSTLLDPGQVATQVADDVALALMDAMEEAIEDEREQPAPDAARIARLEATLALLERALGDDAT